MAYLASLSKSYSSLEWLKSCFASALLILFSSLDWWGQIINLLQPKEVMRCMVCLWGLWSYRNHKWAKEEVVAVERRMFLIEEYVDDILGDMTEVPRGVVLRRGGWRPRPFGWWKVNCDSAFLEDGRLRGTAAIIRDHFGKFIGAFGGGCVGGYTPSMVEALALFHGVRFSRRMGATAIEFETDARMVLNELFRDRVSLAAFGNICGAIHLEASAFSECKFVFTHREGNKAAHSLARFCALNFVCHS